MLIFRIKIKTVLDSISGPLLLTRYLTSILYREMFCFDQNIMKDKWINMGYEERELRPYREPAKDVLDSNRIGKHRSDSLHTCSVYWLQLQYLLISLS